MKVSELIKELKRKMEKHGDLDVQLIAVELDEMTFHHHARLNMTAYFSDNSWGKLITISAYI